MEADDRDKEAQVLEITVTPIKAGEDPIITTYEVRMKMERDGVWVWQGKIGSKEATETFLRGVEAGIAVVISCHVWAPSISPNEETSRKTTIREAFYAS